MSTFPILSVGDLEGHNGALEHDENFLTSTPLKVVVNPLSSSHNL